MSFPFPLLPCELLDDIVDTFVSGRIAVSESSKLALVSRRFKHRIDLHRFAKIELHIHRTPFRRLRTLAKLLGSDVWPQLSALHQYVKSVTLFLGTSETRVDIGYDPDKDEVIATILQTVFRGNNPIGPCSLSIVTSDSFRSNPEMWGLSFNISFGPYVVSALKDLCHNSCMTELCLDSVWNVPPSLLSSSKIKHLRLSNVHFNIHELEDSFDDIIFTSPLSNLKNLFFENTSDFASTALFPEILTKWKHDFTFQLDLENFETWARNNDELAALSGFDGKVDTLIINIFDFIYPPPDAVNYDSFQGLRCLEFKILWDISLRDSPEDFDGLELDEFVSIPEAPAFLTIFNMLPSVLPPVLRINMTIAINWFDAFTASREALDELYPVLYHPSLLDYLKRNSLAIKTRVEFGLRITIRLQEDDLEEDEDNREKEFEEYMFQLLECLTSIDIVVLNIKVSVCP